MASEVQVLAVLAVLTVLAECFFSDLLFFFDLPFDLPFEPLNLNPVFRFGTFSVFLGAEARYWPSLAAMVELGCGYGDFGLAI